MEPVPDWSIRSVQLLLCWDAASVFVACVRVYSILHLSLWELQYLVSISFPFSVSKALISSSDKPSNVFS